MGASQTGPHSSREVFVARSAGPAGGVHSRAWHMRRLALSGDHLLPLVLIGGGLLVAGVVLGLIGVALVALLGLVVVVFVRIWRGAGAAAERDQLEAYAANRQLTYSASMMLIASTPLLAAGQSRRCEHYMHGHLRGVDGVDVGIAHFVVETREHKHDRRQRPIAIVTPHNFTLAIVELSRPAAAFKGVYLARRAAARERVDWLANLELVPATLEHAPLAANCDLLLRPGQDRDCLRELLRVGLQETIAASDLAAGFEYENGTLVVYSPRRLRSGAELDALVSLTGHVARSLMLVGEPLSVPQAISSKAPPTGTAAFPPPPPARNPELEPLLRAAPDPTQPAQPYAADAPPTRAAGTRRRASMPPPAS